MGTAHREHKAILSISLASVEDPSGYGVVELGEAERIKRFVEKPPPGEAPSNWANAGTWLFEPEVLDYIPDERMDRSLEQLVFPTLIADGFVVQGFPSNGYWMDVGTCERYLQLHIELLSGQAPSLLPIELAGDKPSLGAACEVWQDAQLGAKVLLGAGCRIGGLVRIEGPSVLGDNSVIRDKAVVERSVCWSDVKIGSGAVVRDSILGRGCWVGDDAVVEHAVLADGSKVKRGVRLAPGARLEPDEVAG
jgi:mannose-1-phosphate guanylyltransferase